ncbi:MAG TPA: alpha/beta fold hydrolase [Solirubrobacteraceae bacterium]|nr:alpha/beta fold hydrolase [Solirubrobacteraceae bacterium]
MNVERADQDDGAQATPADEPSGASQQRDHIVSLRGLKLFVREWGEGFPLLLINGLGANLEMWGPAQERLSQVARTIAFDAPGMGRSRTSPVVLPHPALAAMICRLLDALDVDQCDVVGYSFGGTVAQQLARQAPDRVRRIALVGTSCGWGSVPATARATALISTPLRYYSRQVLEQTNHLLDSGSSDRESETWRSQAEARLQYPPTLTGYTQQLIAGATWSSLHWVSTLRSPTLVFAGGQDRIVPPANGALLSHLMSESRLHVLPREGHLMLFDPHSRSHELLADFFSTPALEDSEAWVSGDVVDEDQLRETLRASDGLQPIKVLSAIYRGWVGLPAVRRLADDLHLVRRYPGRRFPF